MRDESGSSPRNGPVRSWKLRCRTLDVVEIPLLMGIVNVTPDSFSDGGQFFDPADAVEQGLRLADQGADLLDIGGESTRPGAKPVDADEELRRVIPVVAALCEQTSLPISIDTSKAAVAREALAAGAEAINDVTALTGDAEMLRLAAEAGCGVCAMHARGTPRTMQQAPVYSDVVEEVAAYLADRRDALLAVGIDRQRIALDLGIGFGKTLEHNLALLSHAARFHALGCLVLIGHSRKRFIGELLGDPAADRTAGTVGVAISLAQQGVQVLRVHDVGAVRQALVLHRATTST
ncbi:MAG: dihydropteroate synthase [Candidatus Nealsonbacteria bacterium]|nr:dihydropteroate synthase [Candidatus Nealsonbacteria bacterium]